MTAELTVGCLPDDGAVLVGLGMATNGGADTAAPISPGESLKLFPVCIQHIDFEGVARFNLWHFSSTAPVTHADSSMYSVNAACGRHAVDLASAVQTGVHAHPQDEHFVGVAPDASLPRCSDADNFSDDICSMQTSPRCFKLQGGPQPMPSPDDHSSMVHFRSTPQQGDDYHNLDRCRVARSRCRCSWRRLMAVPAAEVCTACRSSGARCAIHRPVTNPAAPW